MAENNRSAGTYGRFRGTGDRPMMAMIEITNRCNMSCPVCFSDANYPADEVAFEEVLARLERLKQVCGGPVPVQISGGEPTLHRRLPDIIAEARRMGYVNIELITNGIRISDDRDYLKSLVELGLTAVYLQFDSMQREALMQIRGRDMREVREKAVDSIREAGVCCTLAVAVTRGVNDGEVGDIIRWAVNEIDTVRAINFQSATRFTGRFDLSDEKGGYPLPDLLRLIEEKSGIAAESFRSEHMGHPLCNAMSMVFVVKGRLEPLFNYIQQDAMMDFLGNQSRATVLDLFAGKKEFFLRHLCNPKAVKLIRQAAPIFGKNPMNVLSSKHILLFAKSFMERSTLDDERIGQCCYGIAGADGVYSFCAFNNLHRFPERTVARAPASVR